MNDPNDGTYTYDIVPDNGGAITVAAITMKQYKVFLDYFNATTGTNYGNQNISNIEIKRGFGNWFVRFSFNIFSKEWLHAYMILIIIFYQTEINKFIILTFKTDMKLLRKYF